ncbi:MAG: hypothetical protein R3F53_16355 [Gammaproteobacteria bacterium]
MVFVHGTASSPGRWADMLNDLQSDPLIREHFQFWFSLRYRQPDPAFRPGAAAIAAGGD